MRNVIFSLGFGQVGVVKACVYFMQRHRSICYSFGLVQVYSRLNKATTKNMWAEARGKPLQGINIGKSKYTTALNIRCQTSCDPFWNFVVHVKTLSLKAKLCRARRNFVPCIVKLSGFSEPCVAFRNHVWPFESLCGHPKPRAIFCTDFTPYISREIVLYCGGCTWPPEVILCNVICYISGHNRRVVPAGCLHHTEYISSWLL